VGATGAAGAGVGTLVEVVAGSMADVVCAWAATGASMLLASKSERVRGMREKLRCG
jgi:hypothetical protein